MFATALLLHHSMTLLSLPRHLRQVVWLPSALSLRAQPSFPVHLTWYLSVSIHLPMRLWYSSLSGSYFIMCSEFCTALPQWLICENQAAPGKKKVRQFNFTAAEMIFIYQKWKEILDSLVRWSAEACEVSLLFSALTGNALFRLGPGRRWSTMQPFFVFLKTSHLTWHHGCNTVEGSVMTSFKTIVVHRTQFSIVLHAKSLTNTPRRAQNTWQNRWLWHEGGDAAGLRDTDA